MSNIRVHYTRRKSYNTRSNKIRKLRTPGGRLAIQYVGKRPNRPSPALKSRSRLSGFTARPSKIRSQNRVSRPYGGVYTPGQLKERILRAFLNEEVKIVKKMVSQTKAAKPKKTEKPQAAVASKAPLKKPPASAAAKKAAPRA